MTPARLLALLIAAIAAVSLVLQTHVNLPEHDGNLAATLWDLARYFTILTNLLIAITFGRIALAGHRVSALTAGALTSAILLVGIVYHALLADYKPAFTESWFADHGFHTAVPALTFLWWLVYAPKTGLRLSAPAVWIIWPVAYTVYVLIRGLIDGAYPYFFYDIGRFGLGRVALNAAGLALAFYVSGHLLRLIALALTRR